MDARITAEAASITLTASPKVKVVVTTKVDDLVKMLVSLFNPAVILAPLLNQGNSVTAVAPDTILEREVSV
jgi:hypothetical protein